METPDIPEMGPNSLEHALELFANFLQVTSASSKWFGWIRSRPSPITHPMPSTVESNFLDDYDFTYLTSEHSCRITKWRQSHFSVRRYELVSHRDRLTGILFRASSPTGCRVHLSVTSPDSDVQVEPRADDFSEFAHWVKFHQPLGFDERRRLTLETHCHVEQGVLGDHYGVNVEHPTDHLKLKVAFPSLPTDGIVSYRVHNIARVPMEDNDETLIIDPISLTVEKVIPSPQHGWRYSLNWTSPV